MLEFKDLRAGYEGIEKLHGLNTTFESGRLTAIIGPNGCGKSTLIKCAAGLMTLYGGNILLDGNDIRRLSEKERAKRIAYMPQSRIVPDISVARLVAHGRYPHMKWGQNLSREDNELISAAINRVNLSEKAHCPVSNLSGGERQKAYLAMMLAQQTPAMLLDEPTAHLDIASQFELMDLLKSLSKEGRCVAVVLHDLALALEYADSVLLMEDGRIAAKGTPGEIYQSKEIHRVFAVKTGRTDDGKYVFYPDRQA